MSDMSEITEGGVGTEPRSTNTSDSVSKFLSFRVADEDYAVPILQVQEIIGLTKTTVIPNTPDHVLGVINLRGTVVPVLDLRRRLGMPSAERTRTTVNLVVNVGRRTLGLVVDAVSDVVDLTGQQLQPPPEFDCSVDVHFLRGVAHVGDRMMLVLDLEQMLGGAAGEEVDDVELDAATGGR
jgi:purine-binding chemotaxis protein CheW